MPTPHLLLFGCITISPAQRVPCLGKERGRQTDEWIIIDPKPQILHVCSTVDGDPQPRAPPPPFSKNYADMIRQDFLPASIENEQ